MATDLEKQNRIVQFLNGELQQLDRLARLRLTQRELLDSRRRSNLHSLLEDVRETRYLPLRRVIKSIVDGPFGSAFTSADYTSGGAAVIRLGNIGFDNYRPENQAYIPLSLYEGFRSHEVQAGDILIAGLGDARNHAGRACIAPDLGPAIVKGKCFRARTNPQVVINQYLTMLLSSPLGASTMRGRGSTRSMINLEVVKSAILPIPALSAQQAIVAEARALADSTSIATAACDRQITLLAERRQALITAAVTGQSDVSAAIGRGVTE